MEFFSRKYSFPQWTILLYNSACILGLTKVFLYYEVHSFLETKVAHNLHYTFEHIFFYTFGTLVSTGTFSHIFDAKNYLAISLDLLDLKILY